MSKHPATCDYTRIGWLKWCCEWSSHPYARYNMEGKHGVRHSSCLCLECPLSLLLAMSRLTQRPYERRDQCPDSWLRGEIRSPARVPWLHTTPSTTKKAAYVVRGLCLGGGVMTNWRREKVNGADPGLGQHKAVLNMRPMCSVDTLVCSYCRYCRYSV